MKAEIETIEGHASFTNDAEPTVEVNGKKYTAPHILIATGGRPTLQSDDQIPGNQVALDCTSDGYYEIADWGWADGFHLVITGASLGITSDGFFDLEELPK